jgi:hypothetical protein
MATTIGEVNVPMSEVMSGLTLNVRITGMKIAKVRLWLGVQLLKLATLVMGCGIGVSLDD